MKSIKRARVYRFNDQVALNFETEDGYGVTTYIDAGMAVDVARLIHDAAADIYAQPKFHKSTLPTLLVVPCEDGVTNSRVEKE